MYTRPAAFVAAATLLAGCAGSANRTVADQTLPFAGASSPGVAVSGAARQSSRRGAVPAVRGPHIFIANVLLNEVLAYNSRGRSIRPRIKGLSRPLGVAIDGNGKIYVVNNQDGTLRTFTSAGAPTTPVITGLDDPQCVAVDANGKIYITNLANGTLTTYASDGSPTTPTITGLANPIGVAVDSSEKIYVENQGSDAISTFTADGAPTTPTITEGINSPDGLAVDANGKKLRCELREQHGDDIQP